MADILASGVAFLSTALKAFAGQSGTYRRKSGESATLTVTRGRTEREQTTDRSLVSVVKTDDILIAVADFEAAFGDGARPWDGDAWEHNGRSHKVRPLGPEPAWRFSDPGGVVMRVHVKDEGPLVP